MLLTPMRFKEYVWPHNPRVYSIDYERIMAINKIPSAFITCRIWDGPGGS